MFAPLSPHFPVSGLAADLAAVFRDAGYTADGLAGHLGPEYFEALMRGEPATVELAAQGSTPLDAILRIFVVHAPVSLQELADAVGAPLATALVDAGVTIPCADAPELVQVALDIRPHLIVGRNHWVFSDVDAALVPHVPGPDHVLGVGSASLSLLQSTPTSPVSTALDLGTGSGVQLLGQLATAETVTATDVHPRALDLAEATVAAAGVTASRDGIGSPSRVELLQGSWFEPVAGRRFDRIVANPPFVVGLPEVGHVYRDSGLNLDGASELVVSQSVKHLTPGGTAHLLAAWAHQGEVPWQQRVASWLPDKGVRAWIVQRDAADPALYVSTWLKDESVDVRTPEGRERARLWLDHFRANDVHGIGFGYVALQRIGDDEDSDVLAEYMPQPFTDPLGPEVEEYFARAAWLSGLGPGEFERNYFAVRPGLAREDVALPDPSGQGFARAALRLTRTEGPRWQHDVDEHLAAIVAGINPQGLNLEETVSLYATLNDFDEEELLASAIPAFVDLVRHGLVIPADLLDTGDVGTPGDVSDTSGINGSGQED